jgi:hypothetical protein
VCIHLVKYARLTVLFRRVTCAASARQLNKFSGTAKRRRIAKLVRRFLYILSRPPPPRVRRGRRPEAPARDNSAWPQGRVPVSSIHQQQQERARRDDLPRNVPPKRGTPKRHHNTEFLSQAKLFKRTMLGERNLKPKSDLKIIIKNNKLNSISQKLLLNFVLHKACQL